MSAHIQTAVVTGASRGFGRAIAAALTTVGTQVIGIARGGTSWGTGSSRSPPMPPANRWPGTCCASTSPACWC
jgi:nucleoside-diphosphate-sugar epimerase